MATNAQWVNDIVVNWALTATACVLTIGRYVIRYVYAQKLYWDDLAHFIALVTLIAHGATNQVTLNRKADVAAAVKAQVPADQLLAMYQHLLALDRGNNCLLYLVFWEVKVSFLLFYRHLFRTNSRFNIVWWIVLVITVCLVWAPLGGVLKTCAGQSTLEGYEYCNGNTPDRITKLIYTCAVNVGTDLAIMALPFWMLRELKVRTKQKVGLAILFSIALFTVALDIVRTVEAVTGKQDLYTILELNFNVIVSCLPSYRALLKINQRKATKKKYRGPSAGYSGDSNGGPSRRGRKGSIPWLNKGRSRSTAGVLDEAHIGASAGMRNGNKARDIELNSSALRSPRGASGSQGARPKDPYAIESESRTSLVDPKSSTIESTAEEAENTPTSRMTNETKQHSDRDSTEIWDSHRHELPGEVC